MRLNFTIWHNLIWNSTRKKKVLWIKEHLNFILSWLFKTYCILRLWFFKMRQPDFKILNLFAKLVKRQFMIINRKQIVLFSYLLFVFLQHQEDRCLKLIIRWWLVRKLFKKYTCFFVSKQLFQFILCLQIKGTDLTIQDPVGQPDGSYACRHGPLGQSWWSLVPEWGRWRSG